MRLDIVLQITLTNNKAAVLMPLHLYFKVSSITHLFEKTTGTFDHLLITVQGLFRSFHVFFFFFPAFILNI